MYKIELKNSKTFNCDSDQTIFDAAKQSGILLEHSCLKVRCRSCVVKILEGNTSDKIDDLVLSEDEKINKNFTLSCNSIPLTDLKLDVEDLGDTEFFEKKIFPVKISTIEKITSEVLKIRLRLPPSANFRYHSGQYVNLIKGDIKRSYSLANVYKKNSTIEFLIKYYENGKMSDYWFNKAKANDLLRLEGPLGSFFLRESKKENIILLATGTGIAPVKAILEEVKQNAKNYLDKKFWVFYGARYENDIIWSPKELSFHNLKFKKVLSREQNSFDGFNGYVQDALLNESIDLAKAQVYACGSNKMIESSKEILIKNKLDEKEFFSDAFICTNN